MNDQFGSIFRPEPFDNLPKFMQRTNKFFCISQVTEMLELKEIEKRLSNLDGCKSIGPDNVHSLILKNCSKSFALPLTKIFKKLILEGRIQDPWRLANISPIFKKGNRTDPENYRPVSLTSIVSKILEGVVKDELLKYLICNGLVTNSKHGFVPKNSCVTNLLESLDFITSWLSEGYNVDQIFLTF